MLLQKPWLFHSLCVLDYSAICHVQWAMIWLRIGYKAPVTSINIHLSSWNPSSHSAAKCYRPSCHACLDLSVTNDVWIYDTFGNNLQQNYFCPRHKNTKSLEKTSKSWVKPSTDLSSKTSVCSKVSYEFSISTWDPVFRGYRLLDLRVSKMWVEFDNLRKSLPL